MIDGAAENKEEKSLWIYLKRQQSCQIDITAKLDINTTEELVVTYGYDKEADNLLTEEEKSHLLTAGFEYAQSVKIPVGEKYAENYLTLKPSEMRTENGYFRYVWEQRMIKLVLTRKRIG